MSYHVLDKTRNFARGVAEALPAITPAQPPLDQLPGIFCTARIIICKRSEAVRRSCAQPLLCLALTIRLGFVRRTRAMAIGLHAPAL